MLYPESDPRNYLVVVVDETLQFFYKYWTLIVIELLKNNSHGLSPPGGLVSPSGGFVSLLCDQPGPSNGILH